MSPLLTVLIPVWGERHADTFLDLSLPTLKARGNIPALPSGSCELVFLTDDATRSRLENDPRLSGFGHRCTIRFLVEHPALSFPYFVMSSRINHALDRLCLSEGRRTFVAHLPDMLWTDGAFSWMHEAICGGCDGILVSGIRITEEGLRGWLDEGGNLASLSPSTLVALTNRHLHPLYRSCVWEGDTNASVNSHIWLCGTSFLLHNYHPWPVFFRMNTPDARIPWGQTLDHEFLEMAAPGGAYRVVRTPWEMAFLESSPQAYDQFGTRGAPIDIAEHGRWALRWTTPLHRTFAKSGMYFSADPAERPDTELETDALRIISAINDSVPSDAHMGRQRRVLDVDPASARFSGTYEDGWLAPRVSFRSGPARAGDRYHLVLDVSDAHLGPSEKMLCEFSAVPGEWRRLLVGAGRLELDLAISHDTDGAAIRIEFGRYFPHPDGLRRQISAFCHWDCCGIEPPCPTSPILEPTPKL